MENERRAEDPNIKFTEAELALIDQGIAELDRGEGMTIEQATELARRRTKAWTANSRQNAAG